MANDLYQELFWMRQALFDEGLLDARFAEVEGLGHDVGEPNFMVNLIDIYFTDTAHKMDQLEAEMQYRRDYVTMRRLLIQLRGASASFGARRVAREVDQMIHHFDANDLRRLMETYRIMRRDHEALQMRLLPYVQLIGRINQGDGPPDAGSGIEDGRDGYSSDESVVLDP